MKDGYSIYIFSTTKLKDIELKDIELKVERYRAPNNTEYYFLQYIYMVTYNILILQVSNHIWIWQFWNTGHFYVKTIFRAKNIQFWYRKFWYIFKLLQLEFDFNAITHYIESKWFIQLYTLIIYCKKTNTFIIYLYIWDIDIS